MRTFDWRVYAALLAVTLVSMGYSRCQTTMVAAAASTHPSASTAKQKKGAASMMNVQPESSSLILRATHILVVQIESAVAKPWTPHETIGEERIVSLTLKLEEVAKGKVNHKPGDTVRIDVKQVKYFIDWNPPPGIWSNNPIDPKTSLVVFSQTDSHDTAQVLNDPAGIKILPAGEALTDVNLAVQAEINHLNLAGILARAKSAAPSVGELFADYLWARYEPEAMADIRMFERLINFLVDPALSGIARRVLLMTLPSAIDTREPPANQHIDRLAIALFHLLEMPEAKDCYDDIVSTDLPNLLDVTDKNARPANQVFHDFPGEQARALRILAAYKGPESTEPLMKWLKR